jgi:hypothetical protein
VESKKKETEQINKLVGHGKVQKIHGAIGNIMRKNFKKLS